MKKAKKEKKYFIHHEDEYDKKIKYALGYDLEKLYKIAVSELGLQQTKRDQIISLYVTICTFLIPISFSISALADFRPFIFLVIGLIGFLLTEVVARYRSYKEVYWITCITITILTGIDKKDLSKEIIQEAFYRCLKKKGKRVISYYGGFNPSNKEEGKINLKNHLKYGWHLKNSAETLLYCLIAGTASLMMGLFVCLAIYNYAGLPLDLSLAIGIPTGLGAGLILFIYFYLVYVRRVLSIYRVLVDGQDKSFNATFEKAWFLFTNERSK